MSTYVKSRNEGEDNYTMDTSVVWTDSVFDKRFNAYYPIVISTPKGDVIESIEAVNLYIDVKNPPAPGDDDYEYIERELEDNDDVPVVIIRDFMDDLAPNNINWNKTSAKNTMIDEFGNTFNVNVLEYIDTMTVNDTHRTLKSFVVIAKSVQNSSEGLAMLKITVTMANQEKHDIFMAYKSLKPAKWKAHRRNLQVMTGGMYKLFSNDNNTDDEIIDGIRALDANFERLPVAHAGHKTRKRKAKVDDHDDIPKRSLVEYGCFYPMLINCPYDTYYYVVVAADQSNALQVASFTTNPPLPCNIEHVSGIPEGLYNSIDMYNGQKFGTVAQSAENYASSHGNTIFWFKLSDSDFFAQETRFVMNISVTSASDPSIRGTVVVANVNFSTCPLSDPVEEIVVSLDNYANGRHLSELSAMTPVTIDKSKFTILSRQQLLSDVDDDVNEMVPMSPTENDYDERASYYDPNLITDIANFDDFAQQGDDQQGDDQQGDTIDEDLLALMDYISFPDLTNEPASPPTSDPTPAAGPTPDPTREDDEISLASLDWGNF